MNSPPSSGTAPLLCKTPSGAVYTHCPDASLPCVLERTVRLWSPPPTTLATHQATDHSDHFYLQQPMVNSSPHLIYQHYLAGSLKCFPSCLSLRYLHPTSWAEKAPTWLYLCWSRLIHQTSQLWQALELNPRSSILCLHSLLQVILPY